MNLSPGEGPPSSLPFPSEKGFDPQSSGKPAWIVLIEDNPADIGLVQEALDEHDVGCELTVVTDGERALQFIEELDVQRAFCPDLVILDLKLPKKEGHQVLERLRGSAQCAHVPIVILTSSDAKEDRDKAAKLGATRYIRKPDRLDDFILLGAIFKEILTGK